MGPPAYHGRMQNQNYRWTLLLLLGAAPLSAAEMVYRGLPDGPALMREDRQGRLYVTVFGDNGVVVRSDERGTEPWQQGDIDGLDIAPTGDVWMVNNGRVLRYAASNDGVMPIDRTPAFEPVAKPGLLFASRWGDVWLVGCREMLRGDGMYVPTPLAPASGWEMESACDDPFGNVWALGSKPDQNVQTLAVIARDRPHRWEPIPLSGKNIGSHWLAPCADDVGFVWLANGTTVIRVDPRSADAEYRAFAPPGPAQITTIARVANRQLVIGFADGSVQELTVEADQPPSWRLIESYGSGPIRALRHGRDGLLWAVSGSDLYRSEALREEWHRHWEEQPRMPAGNHDNIFARIGNKLYTAGGKTYFGQPAAEWVNLDHVWSYDINQGTWQVEAPMLEPGKAYPGIAALDGELWLIGGNFRNGNSTKATATVEIFDPESGRYRLGPALDVPRDQAVALTVNDRLYCIGGRLDSGEGTTKVVSIAADERHWRPEPDAPGPVYQASGCVIAEKLYVAAGPRSDCPGLFVYDPQQQNWESISHPAPPAPGAPLCAAFEGEVWVMGGRGTTTGLTASHIYSPETGRWRPGPDLPLRVSWGAAAVVNGRLIIAGGAYRDPYVGSVFNSDRVFLLRP